MPESKMGPENHFSRIPTRKRRFHPNPSDRSTIRIAESGQIIDIDFQQKRSDPIC